MRLIRLDINERVDILSQDHKHLFVKILQDNREVVSNVFLSLP